MKNSRKYMSDKYLLLFFVLTLLWTWICGFTPVIFDFTGTPAGTFLFYFGGGAPSVVALFLVFFTYPKEKIKDYFHRCFSFKYMGWRGYALDKLLVRFGFLGASAILGFIWGIWHLPWYFTPGQAQYNLLQDSVFHAIMFIPSVIMLSSWVTFVYIKTKRSILAGALVHMFSNLIGSQLLSSYTTQISMIIRYANMVFFAIIMLYVIFSKKFDNEVKKQISTIKEDEETFLRDVD